MAMIQRLRAGAAMAVLVLLAACSQQVALYNNMSERDANEVLAALDRAGITANKQAFINQPQRLIIICVECLRRQ